MRYFSCRSLLLGWMLVTLPIHPSLAQSVGDENEGSLYMHDSSTGTNEFRWWGRQGKTYFLQYSLNLIDWQFFPDVIVTGADAVEAFGFLHDANPFFVRLNYAYLTSPDPANADFDGDTLSNASELYAGTNPLKSDTDDDGQRDNNDDLPLLSNHPSVALLLYR